MQKNKNNGGYAVVEIVLTVLVIGVAVGAYMTYQARTKAQNAPSTTSAAQAAAAKAAAANATQVQAVKTNVQAFYKTYLASPGTSSFATYESQHYITATAAAATTGKTYDLFACSQSPLSYAKYTFKDPVVSGSAAAMTVTGMPAQGSTDTINLSLKKVGSSWEINAVSCPSLK